MEKIFLEFLKLNKEGKNELSFENKNELNNFKNINANIQQYIKFYEGETTKFINSILNKKIYQKKNNLIKCKKKLKKKMKIIFSTKII